MHFSCSDILRPAECAPPALLVFCLFVYLFSWWRAVICVPPTASGQRQTCWLLGYWETPPALISEERNRWRGRGEVGEEEENRERRETDGWITAPATQSCLFALKTPPHPPFPPNRPSLHPLVISQHKMLRISPGDETAAKLCPSTFPSQSLYKCLR